MRIRPETDGTVRTGSGNQGRGSTEAVDTFRLSLEALDERRREIKIEDVSESIATARDKERFLGFGREEGTLNRKAAVLWPFKSKVWRQITRSFHHLLQIVQTQHLNHVNRRDQERDQER